MLTTSDKDKSNKYFDFFTSKPPYYFLKNCYNDYYTDNNYFVNYFIEKILFYGNVRYYYFVQIDNYLKR